MHGGLGGAMALTLGYAHDPLRVDATARKHLAVVSDQAFADFGFAVTYDRLALLPQPRRAARHHRPERHGRRVLRSPPRR